MATDVQLTYEADFGLAFQSHILAVMMRHPTFALRYRSALSHEFFQDETHKILAKTLLAHIDEFKLLPTHPTLLEDLKPNASSQSLPYVEQLVDKLVVDDISDHAAVAKKVIDFGKTQALCVAVVDSADLINAKKRNKVLERIQRAMMVGEDLLSLGIDYKRDAEERSKTYAQPQDVIDSVTTGNRFLDRGLRGGLGRGELAAFVAPPGKGKTTCLINVGFGAALAGFNVQHYSLEMDEKKIIRRYDDRLMGPLVKWKTKDPEQYGKMLMQRLAFMRGRIRVKHYPTRTASVATFRSHLSMMAAEGFKPDVIIVDYADIVKPERRLGEMRHEVSGVYEDLRTLAGEMNVALWTASQGNKESLEAETVTIKSFSEAFEKAAIVDGAIGFCQNSSEKMEGTCRLFIAKYRDQEDGSTVNCKIMRDRCLIQGVALMAYNGDQIDKATTEETPTTADEKIAAAAAAAAAPDAAKIAAVKASAGIPAAAPGPQKKRMDIPLENRPPPHLSEKVKGAGPFKKPDLPNKKIGTPK